MFDSNPGEEVATPKPGEDATTGLFIPKPEEDATTRLLAPKPEGAEET